MDTQKIGIIVLIGAIAGAATIIGLGGPVSRKPPPKVEGPETTAVFKPEDPTFHEAPEAPTESDAEKASRDYWNAQPRFEAGLLDPLRHQAVPLLGIPYGVSATDAEAMLPTGWKKVDYENANQADFTRHGITFRHYNFATDILPNPKPKSPPGAGGKDQASPRLSCYFLDNKLVGADMNLSDLSLPDQELVDRFVATYGEQTLVRGQSPNPMLQNYVKTISEYWKFGTAAQTESSFELTMMYMGPGPGNEQALIMPEDRLYGRILRAVDGPLHRINMELKAENAAQAPAAPAAPASP